MVRTIAHRLKLMILAISVVALSMALLPASSWGAGVTHLYGWGNPWSSTASGYRYDGPTAVPGVPGTVVQLSTSNSVSYALTQRGEVWAWGAGQFGGLGNGTSPAVQVQPVQVQFPAGIRIASLPSPTPYDAGMAIDTKGHIWGWGSDYEHPFCIGQGNLLYPKKLPFRHVTLASGAGWHALYESDGTLYACGGNAGGELGNGTTVGSITPVRVSGLPDEPIKTLVTSWENSGALLANGSFYDWGYNAADQLGNGTTTDSDVPVHVALPATVAQVSMGGSDKGNGQTVAILKNGAIWAWGSDQFGQVGNDRTEPSSAPAPVAVPPGVTLVQVNSGGSTMFGIDVRGALWSWGENNLGQLGVGGAPFSDVPDEVGLKLSCVSSTATNVAGLRDSARPSSAVCVHSATGRPHHKGRD